MHDAMTCLLLPALLGALACGPAPEPAKPAALVDPCEARASCEIAAMHPIDGLLGAHLARILVNSPECERREHWLISPRRQALLVADCATQNAADSQGPAEVDVSRGHLQVRYVELGASDTCERVDVDLELETVTIERQQRHVGTVVEGECRDERAAPEVPAGDGSVGRPVIVLHRE